MNSECALSIKSSAFQEVLPAFLVPRGKAVARVNFLLWVRFGWGDR